MPADTLAFSDILVLVNHTGSTSIDPQPISESPGHWSLYRGKYRVHTTTIPFELLYLHASVSSPQVQTAAEEVFRPGQTHVVYAPSLDGSPGEDNKPQRRLRIHHDLFEHSAAGFWNTRHYIASFIQDELRRYTERLQGIIPDFFIDPPIEVPAGFRKRRPNPLLTLLLDDNVGYGSGTGHLGLVLAPPGQGKSHACEHLASQLARIVGSSPAVETPQFGRGDVFPIFVNSDQWKTLPVEDLASLSKTIAHSFRHFKSPIKWLEGCEDIFLSVTLKLGLFRIIFDGFDEYVLRNRGQVTAIDALDALTQLTATSRARILVTSRTSFWYTDLEPDIATGAVSIPSLLIYRLLRFDHNHARTYFQKRFPGQTATVTKASNVFDALRRHDEDLVGRGFVLPLVADLATRLGDNEPIPQRIVSLRWLMANLCEREIGRQELPLSTDIQLRTIELFCAEVLEGAAPNSATLDLALEVTADEFDLSISPEEREACLRKMSSHPLIVRGSSDDRWVVPQEQVRFALLASYVLSLVANDLPAVVRRLGGRAELTAAEAGDLAAMIVGFSVQGDRDAEGLPTLRRLVEILLEQSQTRDYMADQLERCRQFGAKVALTSAERIAKGSLTRTEKTELLLSLLPARRLSNLPISGPLVGYDFSGVLFEACDFQHVIWTSCEFSETTVFAGCRFVGGNLKHSSGFGSAVIKDCTMDADAATWINAAQVREGSRRYSEADLRAEIKAVLDKFVAKGGLGLRTIQEGDLAKGTISVSRFKGEIIDEVRSRVLEKHHISGPSEKGLHIREEAKGAVLFYAKNNVFTGPLLDVFEALRQKLIGSGRSSQI